MKSFSKYSTILFFILILFSRCNQDIVSEVEERVLFSVDLDQQKFNPDNKGAYLAAYTSSGELINYGNLTDSIKWELKSTYKEDSIDILYFEFYHERPLWIYHIKNVQIGHSFKDDSIFKSRASTDDIRITLKVEDFGNRFERNMSSTSLPAIFLPIKIWPKVLSVFVKVAFTII